MGLTFLFALLSTCSVLHSVSEQIGSVLQWCMFNVIMILVNNEIFQVRLRRT